MLQLPSRLIEFNNISTSQNHKKIKFWKPLLRALNNDSLPSGSQEFVLISSQVKHQNQLLPQHFPNRDGTRDGCQDCMQSSNNPLAVVYMMCEQHDSNYHGPKLWRSTGSMWKQHYVRDRTRYGVRCRVLHRHWSHFNKESEIKHNCCITQRAESAQSTNGLSLWKSSSFILLMLDFQWYHKSRIMMVVVWQGRGSNFGS